MSISKLNISLLLVLCCAFSLAEVRSSHRIRRRGKSQQVPVQEEIVTPPRSVVRTKEELNSLKSQKNEIRLEQSKSEISQPKEEKAPEEPKPYLGHADPNQRPYNIWSENCHSAANAFCRADPEKSSRRGILKCGGDPKRSPTHHTANWEVLEKSTCIYNWGQACCWDDATNPPFIYWGSGRACAHWACQDQYDYLTTQVYRAGELVEEPGAQACMREQIRKNAESWLGRKFNYEECDSCCKSRGDLWNSKKWGYDKKLHFLIGCRTECSIAVGYRGKYSGSEQSDGTKAGKMCATDTTFFTLETYRSQCENCCRGFRWTSLFENFSESECLVECRSRF